jgi:hypothetical protein
MHLLSCWSTSMPWKNTRKVREQVICSSICYPTWTRDLTLSDTGFSPTSQDRTLPYLNPDWTSDFWLNWIARGCGVRGEFDGLCEWFIAESSTVGLLHTEHYPRRISKCILWFWIHFNQPFEYYTDVWNCESAIIWTATWISSNELWFFLRLSNC